MSRKDYEAFASAINTAWLLHDSTEAHAALRDVMYSAAGWFKHDNSAFNEKLFVAACTKDRG